MAYSSYNNESKENLLKYIHVLELLADRYSHSDNTQGVITRYIVKYPEALDINEKTQMLKDLARGINPPLKFKRIDQPNSVRHLSWKHRIWYCLKVLSMRA